MPYVRWRGTGSAGKVHTGYARVLSLNSLVSCLATHHIVVQDAQIISPFSWWHPITVTMRAHLLSIMATLVRNGIFIDRAWMVAAQSVDHPELKQVLQEIGAAMHRGVSCADACAVHPYLFDGVTCALFGAGQRSGTLDRLLLYLAQHTQTSHQLKKKIERALFMPIVTGIAFLLIIVGIIYFVVPLLVSVYTQSGKAVPNTVQLLFVLHQSLRSLWSSVLIVGVSVGVGWLYVRRRTERYLRMKSWMVHHIPYLGTLLIARQAAHCTHTIGLLIRSHVRVVDAVNIVAQGLDAYLLRDQLQAVEQAVQQGSSLAVAFESVKWPIPVEAYELIIVGEQTGNLGDLVEQAALCSNERAVQKLETTIASVQPILIITLALLVVALILMIYLPLLDFSVPTY
ncbi:MAG: type II secretion system F family protein [Candidatus Babeliales bacterium]